MIKITPFLCVMAIALLILSSAVPVMAERDTPEGEHEAHGDQHEEQDQGRTQIDADAARAAGIEVATAGPRQMREQVTLTGRIRMNPDALALVRARFPGVVQTVNVKLGERVTRGGQLAVVEANESLKNYPVLAPMDGLVVERNIYAGTMTGEQPLFVIADLSVVWSEFHVFPKDLARVQAGQSVRVYTLMQQPSSEAPITFMLPLADEASQSVVAIVPLANDGGHWRPGITVYGDVRVAEFSVPLAVHKDAVQRMEEKTVVFVQEGNYYEARPVTLGRQDNRYIEVLSGLEPGEVYVSQGSFTVKADIGKHAAGHDHH
jgi:cobalt-zinc-cadmium efflux system membrane fusion protein